jgi:hypothetical protein
VSPFAWALAAGTALAAFASGADGRPPLAAASTAPPVAAAATPPTTLSWERAFPVERAAPDVHLEATFHGSDGKPHRLELWRHGRTFLHRKTDDQLDLYVVARSGNDYAYRFFDHRRHVVTGVRRDNLYRLGVFSDWFGLAHVVDRPKAAFELRAVAEPHPETPRRDCAWRELVTGKDDATRTVARICWSSRWATALAIEQRGSDGSWAETFSVRTAEATRFRRGETSLPATPSAYAFVDADREIAPQTDD